LALWVHVGRGHWPGPRDGIGPEALSDLSWHSSAVVLLTAHRTLAGRPARLLFRDPHLAAVRAWRQGTLLALSAVPSAQRRRPAHTMKSYQPAAAYPASSGARNGRTSPPGGVAQNVAVVAALEEAALAQRTRGECLAERIMQWAGTPRFLPDPSRLVRDLDHPQRASHPGGSRVRPVPLRVLRRIDDVWTDAIRYTKRQPVAALLIAGALGLTLGLFVKRGR
jgi:hypothetical protein